jgi:hypothetical protein
MVFQLTHLSPNYRFKYKVLTIKSILLPGVTNVVFVLVGQIQLTPRHNVCCKMQCSTIVIITAVRF